MEMAYLFGGSLLTVRHAREQVFFFQKASQIFQRKKAFPNEGP